LDFPWDVDVSNVAAVLSDFKKKVKKSKSVEEQVDDEFRNIILDDDIFASEFSKDPRSKAAKAEEILVRYFKYDRHTSV
jgi:hypothetical protein